MSVYLSTFSLTNLFLCRDLWGLGGYKLEMQEEKQGQLLHLGIIKDGSGVPSLVCLDKCTVYGFGPETR